MRNAGGVYFLSGEDTDLYVEAVSGGTATLSYSYTGTGDAENIGCEASLKMTAYLPKVEMLMEISDTVENVLPVAKRENAFSNGCVQAGGVIVTNAVYRQSEFIGADVDRFRVRVTDGRRADAESVEVVLRTEHPCDSTYDASPRYEELMCYP